MKEKRSLPVALTQEELLEKSQELAKDQLDIKDTEARAKDVAADFKAIIAKLDATIGILSRAITNGYEYREVECEWQYNYKTGIKTLTRLDTGKTVKEEIISDHERQIGLEV